MIYSYDVLVGYVTMRGSFIVHIPMFISMIAFLSWNIPSDNNLEWSMPGANVWFNFGLGMHAVLGIIHIGGFFEFGSRDF